MKIYNLGSMNIDYVYQVSRFPKAGETISTIERNIYPGGKGLNQSVALAKAGGNVVHGGIVGSEGQFLIDILNAANVETKYIQKINEASGHTMIQVDASGENCILLYPGANHRFTVSYIKEVLSDAQKGDFLILQNEINGLKEIFDIAKEKQMQIVFNPSPYDQKIKELPLSWVDWWICNEVEGEELTGEERPKNILEVLSGLYPKSHIVLTLGAEGAMYKKDNQVLFQPAFKTEVTDTTAAGDTFTGYFIAAVAEGLSIQEAMKRAAVAASIAVSKKGAASSIPELKEVKNIESI